MATPNQTQWSPPVPPLIPRELCGATGPIKNSAPINLAMEELDKRIHILTDIVGTLCNRLSPVLAQIDQVQTAVNPPPPQNCVPIVRELDKQTARLEEIYNLVHATIECLAI